jgi:hypothetical protein
MVPQADLQYSLNSGLLGGQSNLLSAPAGCGYPTIEELYNSLNQLPPMRSSISLQNLHQGRLTPPPAINVHMQEIFIGCF